MVKIRLPSESREDWVYGQMIQIMTLNEPTAMDVTIEYKRDDKKPETLVYRNRFHAAELNEMGFYFCCEGLGDVGELKETIASNA